MTTFDELISRASDQLLQKLARKADYHDDELQRLLGGKRAFED